MVISLDIYDYLRKQLGRELRLQGLEEEQLTIRAFPLTPEEAIGSPEDRDYPIIKGKECLIEAEVLGARGHAFTDEPGDFQGSMEHLLALKLEGNRQRAFLVAALNALWRHLGKIERSLHCRDQEPRQCARMLAEYIAQQYGTPRIALVGYQPRFVEHLVKEFPLQVFDLDPEHINQVRFGKRILSGRYAWEHVEVSDLVLVTGSTVVNRTIKEFLPVSKPTIFYGVTIAATAQILGLRHYCPLSH